MSTNFSFSGIFLTLAVLASSITAQKDLDAKVLSSPPLVMSDAIFDAGISGRLVFDLSVDSSGKVVRAQLVGGPMWRCGEDPTEQLNAVRKLAADVMLATIFSPRIKDGKAKATDLKLSFVIKPPDEKNSAAAQKTKIIKEDVVNGRAISLPPPKYPAGSVAGTPAGVVSVEVLIDEEGRVTSAGAINGAPRLHQSVRDAACIARFSPTAIDGTPVRVQGLITYSFLH